MEDYGFICCVSPFQIVIVVSVSGALYMLSFFCFVSGKSILPFLLIFFSVFPNLKFDCLLLTFFLCSFKSVCLYYSFFWFCVIVSRNPFVYLIFHCFNFIFSYLLYVIYKVYCSVVNLFSLFN